MIGKRWIRKGLAVMLLAVLLAAGAGAEGAIGVESLRGYDIDDGYQYVLLGQYPQEIDGGTPDEGDQTWRWRASYQKNKDEKEMHEELIDPDSIPSSPILWRVLSVNDSYAFILSEFILFPSPMHLSDWEYQDIGKDYGKTDLCAKLNGEFAEKAFTAAEMAMFLPFEDFGKIFILSAADLKDKSIGFGTKKSRKCWATEYSIRACGGFVYRTAVGNSSPYWLRDQSTNNRRAARCTKQDGDIGYYNCRNPEEGVRPAVHLDMTAFRIVEGAGTRANPFVIEPK